MINCAVTTGMTLSMGSDVALSETVWPQVSLKHHLQSYFFKLATD